jgi:putative transcriptional regulator
MTDMIKSRLHVLMAEKGRLTIRGLARKAGISEPAVSRLYHDTAERFDRSTLNSLCRALDCQPGELLEYVPDRPKRRAKKAKKQG